MAEKFWLHLEVLALSVEDEAIVDRLAKEIQFFSPAKLIRTREHVRTAIVQLSRLAARLNEQNPLC